MGFAGRRVLRVCGCLVLVSAPFGSLLQAGLLACWGVGRCSHNASGTHALPVAPRRATSVFGAFLGTTPRTPRGQSNLNLQGSPAGAGGSSTAAPAGRLLRQQHRRVRRQALRRARRLHPLATQRPQPCAHCPVPAALCLPVRGGRSRGAGPWVRRNSANSWRYQPRLFLTSSVSQMLACLAAASGHPHAPSKTTDTPQKRTHTQSQAPGQQDTAVHAEVLHGPLVAEALRKLVHVPHPEVGRQALQITAPGPARPRRTC